MIFVQLMFYVKSAVTCMSTWAFRPLISWPEVREYETSPLQLQVEMNPVLQKKNTKKRQMCSWIYE